MNQFMLERKELQILYPLKPLYLQCSSCRRYNLDSQSFHIMLQDKKQYIMSAFLM